MHGLGVRLLSRVFTEDSTMDDRVGFLALNRWTPGIPAFTERCPRPGASLGSALRAGRYSCRDVLFLPYYVLLEAPYFPCAHWLAHLERQWLSCLIESSAVPQTGWCRQGLERASAP